MSEPDHPAPFEAPDPERLAPLFPGYSMEGLIATGGMGAVYKAIQISLDRPVAIKILPREFGQDQQFRDNFQTEARTMARLNHPNLIGVHDFGEVDGMLFIIMEFVPGKTLFHSANGRAIAADESARIVIGVCQALAHAHEHGILHRDIKPANILLDQQARPKIGDFGLARPIGTSLKDGEKIYGTPHYTAPEVVRSPDTVDARADIFSVGVVLHELLTGQLPEDDPRPPSVIVGCDPRFDVIIRRATQPSPNLRHASAAEVAHEIGMIVAQPAQAARLRTAASAAATGGPVPARGMSVALPSKPRQPFAMVAYWAAAAALVFALFVAFQKPDSPRQENTHRPEPVTRAPEPEPPPVKEPEPEIVRIKPEPEAEMVNPEPEITKQEPEPEVVMETPAPVVKESLPPKPAFDVPAFLDRARLITRQRAAPLLATNAEELEKNFSAFERRVEREVRDLDKFTRDLVETSTEEQLATWRKDGDRVPKSLELPGAGPGGRGGRGGRGLRGGEQRGDFFKAFEQIHAEYLTKQQKIDEQLEVAMLDLSNKVYLLGLRKQIERLTDPNEAPSVALIQTEVDAVQANSNYFVSLMRGVDPKDGPAKP